MGAFPAAIVVGFMNYAKFSGVASRAEYWYWYLFTSLISPLLTLGQFAFFLSGLSSPRPELDSYLPPVGYWVVGALAFLFSLATLVPTLAVTVRRLRDGGYDWVNIFWGFVPFVGFFILLYYLIQPTQNLVRNAYGY